MSGYPEEFERVKREIEEFRRRNEELEKQKNEAEKKNEELEKQKNETEKKNEELGRRNQAQQPTTLDEYLEYCHHLLFQSLEVQPDKSKSSTGGTTKVDGKCYPLFLLPWNSFAETQRQHFDIIRDAFRDEQFLPSWMEVFGVGRRACESPVASEDDIRPFEYLAVEGPVKDIICALGTKFNTHPAVRLFDVSRISFTNHSYGISQGDSEAGTSDGAMPKPPRQTAANERVALGPKAPSPKPDRRCIRENPTGVRTTAFVVEHKVAYKVLVGDLQQALDKKSLFMEVIKRNMSGKQSTDEDQRRRDRADELVAMILTQTFHYMVEFGLEYSYFTAGKSLIFLWIKEDQPRTLYYRMATPHEEVNDEEKDLRNFNNPSMLYDRMVARRTEADGGGGNLEVLGTAVAQVASFCLLTFRSRARTEEWVKNAKASLREWPILYPEIDYERRDDEESGPATQSTDSSFLPSAKEISSRTKLTCKDTETIHSSGDDGNDDDGDGGGHISEDRSRNTQARARAPNKRKQALSRSGSSGRDEAIAETEHQTRKYCTQACLLGLKRGGKLDENCPNVSSHRTIASATQHPIHAGDLARLIREQLGRYRDRDCEPLEKYGKHGARGTLFKLTLAPYGYTFVGKGTIAPNVRYLLHEGRVYGRLERLQGEVVPVFLGNIDLVEPYHLTAMHSYYFTGASIVHMLLMSWAGEGAAKAGVPDAAVEVARSSRAVLSEGVAHDDEREANILWNEERRRVMLIDFDRAAVLPTPKQAWELTGKNHRKRMVLDNGLLS